MAIADDRGAFAGFLTAVESVTDPRSPIARVPERSALHLVHGHAVAASVAPGPAYAALFGELARRALERGVTDHVAHVPIGDPATEAAWVALGFGRVNAVAVRDLAPVDRPLPFDVEVRIATPDELDVVDRLVDEEAVFHAGSPIFRPYLRDATVDAVRASSPATWRVTTPRLLLARRRGRDVGVLSVGPGLGSPLYVPDVAAYVAATAVLPDDRGAGAGAALVDGAFAWARDHGHTRRRACTTRRRMRPRRRSGRGSASGRSWPTCDGGSTSASSTAAPAPDRHRSPPQATRLQPGTAPSAVSASASSSKM